MVTTPVTAYGVCGMRLKCSTVAADGVIPHTDLVARTALTRIGKMDLGGDRRILTPIIGPLSNGRSESCVTHSDFGR